MEAEPAVEQSPPTSRSRSVSSLLLFLFLSLVFAAAMSQVVLGDTSTTTEVWVASTISWGVIWVVFALLQVRWWARGDEKFWRPIYAWALLGFIVLSLIALPILLWPRFRRWLFRVMKPNDPPEHGLEASLRALARLRDEGLLTAEEFEAKKAEVLRLA